MVFEDMKGKRKGRMESSKRRKGKIGRLVRGRDPCSMYFELLIIFYFIRSETKVGA